MKSNPETGILSDEKKLYVFNEGEMDNYFKERPWEKEYIK